MVSQISTASGMIATATAGYVSQPWMQTAVVIAAILVVSSVANWIAKHVVLRILMRLVDRSPFAIERPQLRSIVARLSNIVPALIIQIGVSSVPHLPGWIATLVRNVTASFIILTIAIAISGALSLANDVYQRRPEVATRPVKGYVQVGKLVVYGAATILIIAALLDRSPLLLLSGLGAMAAVLMLVFKDTILSLVASVQIGSNDMIRVGDWIEMPQLNADGDVIDIALHTVKIQNFDKTITTIPTHRLITESFKNWRGMAESGGRRIMRSVVIDQNSVGFLDADQIGELERFVVLQSYLEEKRAEMAAWNAERAVGDQLNSRRMTNIGTFRAYILAYLRARDDIAEDKTLLVRQLAPTENGLPMQIYAFASTTIWADYEDIQADIFDHLMAILPVFGLRLFQQPTGLDFQPALRRMELEPA